MTYEEALQREIESAQGELYKKVVDALYFDNLLQYFEHLRVPYEDYMHDIVAKSYSDVKTSKEFIIRFDEYWHEVAIFCNGFSVKTNDIETLMCFVKRHFHPEHNGIPIMEKPIC